VQTLEENETIMVMSPKPKLQSQKTNGFGDEKDLPHFFSGATYEIGERSLV